MSVTQTSKPTASSGAYETCRKCGEPEPCACPRKPVRLTVASWKGRREPESPRLRWLDWVEFVLVCVAVWLAVVRPPLPWLDSGGCGTGVS